MSLHVAHLAAAFADFFDDGALIVAGTWMVNSSYGSVDPAAFAVKNDFRLRDLQLVPFPAHLFDQHGQVQLAAAGHEETVGAVGFLDAQRDVGLELFEQALAQVARREEFALPAGEGAVVDGEGHLDRRLIDASTRGKRHRIARHPRSSRRC